MQRGASSGETAAVVPGDRTGAAGEATTVEPHHHRQRGGRRPAAIDRRPHVQVQAVLGLRLTGGRQQRRRLHGAGPELAGVSRPGPGLGRQRGPQPELADRWPGVGDPGKTADRRLAGIDRADQRAGRALDEWTRPHQPAGVVTDARSMRSGPSDARRTGAVAASGIDV